MSFVYSGFDASGKAVAGSIDASAPAEAIEALRKRGIFTTAVKAEDDTTSAAALVRGGTKAGLQDLSQFYRQLSVLMATKTPLLQALVVAEKQTRTPALKSTVADLRKRVEEGESLAAAMASNPRVFDSVARSMVAAGEAAGMLDKMLASLSILVRRQLTIRRQIIGTLTYPVILISVSFCVVIALLVAVLPQFAEMFKSMQTPLPPTTKMLMWVGDVLRQQWMFVIPAAVAAATGLYLSIRSPKGIGRIDAFLVTAPRIGPMRRSFAVAGFCRLLGTLIDARVPLLDAIRLTRESIRCRPYADLLQSAEIAVERGQPLAESLNDERLIDPAVTAAISSGERGGKVGPVLLQVADYLDEDNEQFMKLLSTILEPVVLGVVGALVGGIAISMFLPLFDLAASAGGASGGAP
ncbi:MAG: type II secretion system F family protein [Phycisphaerales bacterium]|nr:type II secretion system F family protein [Phycisphaerales bacterium]